jgi:cell wall-associated NlpC family hydrolase
LAQSFAGRDADALCDHYKISLKRQLHFIISKHPEYTWGGAEDLEKGLDCSGYIYLACKWAGIPGVTRTTSYRMALGLGGWVGEDIDADESDECDLPFWTFKEGRPFGHVGAFLRYMDGGLRAAHASTRRGVVLQELNGSLLRNLTKVRRLTIGE